MRDEFHLVPEHGLAAVTADSEQIQLYGIRCARSGLDPCQYPFAVILPEGETTDIDIAIGERQGPLAVKLAIFELTLIAVAARTREPALAVWRPTLKRAFVQIALGRGVAAQLGGFSVLESALVAIAGR